MIIILCTIPKDKVMASNIIKTLLTNKLAACITLLQEAHSFYYWQNKLESQIEMQLLIKTHHTLQEIIFNTIKKIHPYEVPELLVLSVVDGEKNYLSWIKKTIL